MNGMQIESVCIFGSGARGTIDKCSDQDMLVICNDSNRRRQINEYWKNAGWSVALYTPSRFLKMIQSGSLFVQHIKLEGVILEDKGDWLQEILDQAQPLRCYEFDARSSVNLALPLERFCSDWTIEDNLIVADIAYVAVRNFGICHLASKGKFIFEYGKILDRLSDEYGLHESEYNLLKGLRFAKASFRNGEVYNGEIGTVREVRNVLSKFFPHRPLTEINQMCSIRPFDNGYLMLRDLEAAIFSRFLDSPINSEVAEVKLGAVWGWIRDPRSYSWNVRNLRKETMNLYLHNFFGDQNLERH